MRAKQRVGAATLLRSKTQMVTTAISANWIKLATFLFDLTSSPDMGKAANSPDPHRSKRRNCHLTKQDHARPRPRKLKDPSRHDDIHPGLGERGGDGEAADEEHDRRAEHLGEDVSVEEKKVEGEGRIVRSAGEEESEIEEVEIKEETDLVASEAERRVSWPSLDRMTRKTTTRKGTEREVTKRGMALDRRGRNNDNQSRSMPVF
jgi:hypothetical protein